MCQGVRPEPGLKGQPGRRSETRLAITNLVLDVVILVLPMSMVIDLRLPLAQKYLLYGLFGLGGM